jgi:hypothetical protein
MDHLLRLAVALTSTPTPSPPVEVAQEMSDTTKLILTALATVFVTIVTGLVAAWISRRGEHKKWLREERLKAYTGMLTFLRGMHNIAEAAESRGGELAALSIDLAALSQRMPVDTNTESVRTELESELERVEAAINAISEDNQIPELKRVMGEFSAAYAALTLVGPVRVSNLAQQLFTVIRSNFEHPPEDEAERFRRYAVAENAFMDAAHKVLGVTKK